MHSKFSTIRNTRMNYLIKIIILLLCCIDIVILENTSIGNGTLEMYRNEKGKVLSRKKRYLIFPEGSSLQLVYCLTIPSIGMGSIFTLGSTAALAWELPHDPFVPFRKPSELLHRSDTKSNNDDKNVSGGWTLENTPHPTYVNTPSPYSSPFNIFYYSTIYNKRPQSPISYNTIKKNRLDLWTNKRSNLNKNYPNFLNHNKPIDTYVNPVYHHIHRRTRRDLYAKLQTFLTALSKDGKACILKAVCEVSQVAQKKGTFMEEIIKAVFSVKPHDSYPDEDEYDKAANINHNCTDKYMNCEHSIWEGMI